MSTFFFNRKETKLNLRVPTLLAETSDLESDLESQKGNRLT